MLVKVFNIKYKVHAEGLPEKKVLLVDNNKAITKEFLIEEVGKLAREQIEDLEYTVSPEVIDDVDQYNYWLHKSDCFMQNEN